MLTYQLIGVLQRRKWLDYLLLADEEVAMIERYLDQGQLYTVIYQEQVIGVIHLLSLDEARIELKNIGLLPEWRNRGFGRQMMAQVVAFAQQQGAQTLLVGTGDASLAAIAFYLQTGFRFVEIRKDFFKQYQTPIYENGICLKDMVVLAKKL